MGEKPQCSATLRFSFCAFLLSTLLLSSTANAQLRIVNYNIAQLRGNITNLQNVFAALHDDDKPGFAVPVSIFVFQEVRAVDINALQAAVDAAAPPGVTYVRATYTTSASEDSSAGAQAAFFRSGLINENTAAHQDIYTQAGRNADRWHFRLTGYSSPFASIYLYAAHLKSDVGTANQNDRLLGVTAIRNNADALSASFHLIYCGDMNFYNNNEPGYLQYFVSGNGQAIDPLGTGSWAGGSFANNIKHSQSPVLTGVNGLVGGGMDDRFDFQLSTSPLHDNLGLSIISNTYRTFGNDGNHYNIAIDTGNNTYYPAQLSRSNTLATNLRLASDHIPTIVEYKIPAMMAGSIPANYGRVIIGASFNVAISVTNPAPVAYVFGADQLTYTATATVNLSGVTNGTVNPLGDTSTPSFPLNTSAAGIKPGTVTLSSSSQGVQPTSVVLNTTGTVVRHAAASFSNSSLITQSALPLAYDANTGTHNFSVNVYNLGFDSLQALLDIDSVTGALRPFAYLGGAATGVGSTPATLNFSFNTTGLTAGRYTAPIVINTSDENLPGESTATLNLTISVTINSSAPCPADTNHDGVVNVTDLLAVINAWGPCQPPCPADTNADGQVNVTDLLTVINAWGACP